MCWNEAISLNTFIFSFTSLMLIAYNNEYTKYKIPEFKNRWTYIFFLSFIFMQLIEFFIWKNIKNANYNKLFTTLAILLVTFQPFATIMIIDDKKMKLSLLLLYFIIIVPRTIYLLSTRDIKSTISDKKHLIWTGYRDINIFILLWLVLFLFPLFYEGFNVRFSFAILTLLFITYNYLKDGSLGSMWCWIVNICMIYYLVYLLLYLPYYG